VTGTGSSQPAGIITGASAGVTGSASVAGAFSADNLIDLFYSVISPYRNSNKAAWLMRDATVGAARKLKGSDNNYLWQPGLQVGSPDTLLGKPVLTDPNVAAVGLSAKSVAFGDIGAYHTRIAGGVRFERSDEYAFNTDLVTFRAIVRGDGILADQTGAVKVFTGNAA
jgi:HK97 family phage major capsid protein